MRSNWSSVVTWSGLGLMFTGAIVLSATTSSADDQRKLTTEQAEAKATFETAIQSSLNKVEEHCGAPIVVTTDFENYKKRENSRTRPVDDCLAMLDGVAKSCAAETRVRARGGTPPKKFIPAKVTSARCLFAGAQAKQAKDLNEDDIQRNLTFSNGVITIRMRDMLMNIEQTVFDILRGQTVEKTQPLKVGASCTKGGQCRTGLCSRSVCTTCTSSSACGAGHFCSTTSGNCYADDEPRESPSGSSSSSSTPTKRGKGLGAMCKATSECESGRTCKVKTSKLSTCQ